LLENLHRESLNFLPGIAKACQPTGKITFFDQKGDKAA